MLATGQLEIERRDALVFLGTLLNIGMKWFCRAGLLFTCLASVVPALAEMHPFSYSGALSRLGVPVNGSFEFRFTVYDALAAGGTIGAPLTNSAVAVSNGLFTVALDFGPEIFTGPPRWLEIAVRTNGSAADFDLLAPRQAITAAPYALHALSAASTRTLPADSVLTPATLLVDAVNGRDEPGRREAGMPFKSISNAVAAARSGDVVHIRQGRYTNTLNYYPVYSYAFLITGKTNITVRGDGPGTVIYGEGAGTFIGVGPNCQNIVFRDFSIEGNKGAGSAGESLKNGLVAGIRFFGSNVRDCLVERVMMKNLPNHGVASFHSTEPENIIIRNCHFENGGATNGVRGLGGDGAAIVLEGQRWQAINNFITNWARGIEIYTPQDDLHGLVARGNVILGVPWQGITSIPHGTARVLNPLITDNLIEGTPALATLSTDGIFIARGFENGVIARNNILGMRGNGIWIESGHFQRNTISHNHVSDCQLGITLWDSSYGTNLAHNLVTHNIVHLIGWHGIQFNGVNNSVAFNQVTCFATNNPLAFGIRTFGPTAWNAITDNIIADGPNGIGLNDAEGRTNRVVDNHLTRVTTAIINSGTGTILRDNTQ